MKRRALVLAILITAGAGQARASEIAKVNGQSLTDRDLKLALSSMNEGMRENVLKDPNTRREILNAVIDQEILVDEAVKEKLDQDQDYKDAQAMFRRQYLATRALDKNLGSKLSDSSARKYYEANKPHYSTDQVHALQILLKDEDQANELLKLAKAKDADFQELAAKYSIDPSAKNNRGDLGVFGRNAPYDPAFLDGAFSGSSGEIVGPIKTRFGYHILKVVEKKFGKPLTFDEVEVQVKHDLGQSLREAYLGKLRKGAKVQIHDSALDKI